MLSRVLNEADAHFWILLHTALLSS
jgi:hypothetical protein